MTMGTMRASEACSASLVLSSAVVRCAIAPSSATRLWDAPSMTSVRRHLEDPHTLEVFALYFQAWGRKPEP